MEAGIQSMSGLTMPVPTQADSPSMLALSLEEVSTTTPTVGNTFSPSAAPAPTHTTISQLPPSIPTSAQTKPSAPAAPADNKPSSSSSQPTAPSLDAKYAPTKPTCIPVNVISVTTTPSAPSVISTTTPVLTTGVAAVGHTFKNPTLQDHSFTSTKPSEMTATDSPKTGSYTMLLDNHNRPAHPRGYIDTYSSIPHQSPRIEQTGAIPMVARDLEQFSGNARAFWWDFRSTTEDVYRERCKRLRNRFEEILGDADMEKK
ncbi:hypothetical protein EV421DRAFT_1905366 [Armillaria borealis]|uniref:Uncharacterized protein n=1 Tax=Armillaria borealis TaxID=47425 RepID=A0AA39MP60_9AGAR|nr:hypothetical protein EV421DRAFT_1905366 [Armillaria borealis]